MTTAVDANVLIDVLSADTRFANSSEERLGQALLGGPVIISEPVYAELAPQFVEQSALDDFLSRTGIQLRPTRRSALVMAAQAWIQYLRSRERGLQCPSCGARRTCPCENCGRDLSSRQHILTDFMVGAHAIENDARLLTRDRGYFRTYFPELELF